MCGDIHLLSAFVSYGIDVLRKRVNSADNFYCMFGEITFASKKHAVTPVVKRARLMYFKCRLPGQEPGYAPVLHILFIKAEWLGESQKMVSAVCSAHGMEGAEKSPHRPLLYGASYSERDYQEEEMDSGVCKCTSG